MTQLASEQSILAPFDGRDLVSKEGQFKVARQGPGSWRKCPIRTGRHRSLKTVIAPGQSEKRAARYAAFRHDDWLASSASVLGTERTW